MAGLFHFIQLRGLRATSSEEAAIYQRGLPSAGPLQRIGEVLVVHLTDYWWCSRRSLLRSP
jgi:hypothetical protein